MKISELKNAPQWLLNAVTQNADVEIIDGRVIWKSGIWFSGAWEDGTWHDGTWHDGTWLGGDWKEYTWKEGEDGLCRDGTWKSGAWQRIKPLIEIDVKYATMLAQRLQSSTIHSTSPFKLTANCPICDDPTRFSVNEVNPKDDESHIRCSCWNCDYNDSLRNHIKEHEFDLYGKYLDDLDLR